MIKQEDKFSKGIIGAAIEIHHYPELFISNLTFERLKPPPLSHKGVKLDCGYC
jgi:hypothetical protein